MLQLFVNFVDFLKKMFLFFPFANAEFFPELLTVEQAIYSLYSWPLERHGYSKFTPSTFMINRLNSNDTSIIRIQNE